MIDALAPTNSLLGNPAALKPGVRDRRPSVTRGIARFLDDVANNGGRPRQVDLAEFEIGKDLAATPGKVVFRNELIELIQYAPPTKTVHEMPLLLSARRGSTSTTSWIWRRARASSSGPSATGTRCSRSATGTRTSRCRDFGFDDYLRERAAGGARRRRRRSRARPRSTSRRSAWAARSRPCCAAYLAAGKDGRIGYADAPEHAARLHRARRARRLRRRRRPSARLDTHDARDGLPRRVRMARTFNAPARQRPDLELRRRAAG